MTHPQKIASLDGRPLAAITGASSGIGQEYARRLAATHDLLLIARREERLRDAATSLEQAHATSVEILVADLADASDVARVGARLATEPHLALLVNNAGFGHRGVFWESDVAVLESMHRLHVLAILRLTHAALGGMVTRNHGAVINVASIAAFAQRADNASYGATKSWLATFTEGLYLDLCRTGSAVTVQALCPGYTYSEFHDLLGEDRRRLAPAFLWYTAAEVVDESLRALASRRLIVIPGWPYRWLIAVLTRLPFRLKLWLEGPRR